MQTQFLVANIKVTRFIILRTQNSLNCTCLHFSNARSPAVITHNYKDPLRQGFVNISDKSVSSSPDIMRVQAHSDLWAMLECVVFHGHGIGRCESARHGSIGPAYSQR